MRISLFLLALVGGALWAQTASKATTKPAAAKPAVTPAKPATSPVSPEKILEHSQRGDAKQADQLPAPAALPPISPDAVAVLNGRGYTKEELETIIKLVVPAQQQPLMLADPKYFLTELGRMQVLAADAVANGLDKKTPYKERYLINQLRELAGMQITDLQNQEVITPAALEEFYEKNKERYEQIKISAIYIPFITGNPNKSSAGEKLPYQEPEAKALAEKIVKDVRGGEAFAKMAEQYSGDEATKKKGGEFGIIKRSDGLPEDIKKILFSLNKGETSEPIRQANGYYIFQVTDLVSKKFEDVKEDIFKEIRDLLQQRYLKEVETRIDLKVLDAEYFKPKKVEGKPGEPMPTTPPKPNVK